MEQRRKTNLKRALTYLGGHCAQCDTIEHLEFDHIDPATKLFCISQKLSKRWVLLVVEVDKCQLLCEDCHFKKTIAQNIEFGEIEKPIPHGTTNGYRHFGCRCQKCRDAHREYARKYTGSKPKTLFMSVEF